VKSFVRLAILTLFTPALLLVAQTPASQTPAPQASPDKPASAQAPTTGGKEPAAPAAQTGGQSTEPAKPRVPGQYPVMGDKAKQRARELYDYFTRGQGGLLYTSFSPELKKQYPEANITTISKQLTAKFGSPTNTLSESFLPSPASPVTLYSHTTLYSKPDPKANGGKQNVAIMVVIGVDEKGQLTEFQAQPVPPVPRDQYSDYQDVTKLHLPFNGEWTVLQGGRNLFDNSYVGTEDNRYGVSFILLKDGMQSNGSAAKNTDFYCFGQPVLTPASGTVVQASNSYQDHAPGRPPEIQSRGNYVVIAHGNSEYSLIPYLKAGSVKVKVGQRLKQGDVVGECGDSGSSPFPHVEYSLQNTRGFPLPKSMPAQFVDYVADGKPVPIGEPLRGQTVTNQTKTPPVETAGKP
jgi:hypothetical protein